MRRVLLAWLGCLASALALAETPVLRVAAVALPPYVHERDGDVVGLLPDLLAEASRRAGLPYQLELMPWARATQQIQNQQAHALMPTLYKAERETWLYFPETAAHRMQMILISAVDLPVGDATLESLAGARFVALRGASAGERFDALVASGRIQPQLTNSFLSLCRMVAAHRADYAVIPQLSALYFRQTGLTLQLHLPPVDALPVYIAFGRQTSYPQDLRARWQAAFADLAKDGTLDALADAYGNRLSDPAAGEPAVSNPAAGEPAASVD